MEGETSAWIPVIAALGGAAIGFIGAGVVRLLFDRRQEFVRAQAYARVILDELRGIATLLDPELSQEDPIQATEPLPTDAWIEHRTQVAAALLPDEFLGLSSTYRWVASANRVSFAVRREWEIAAAQQGRAIEPVIPDGAAQERQYVRLAVEQIGIPCIDWLAVGKLPLLRRRPRPIEMLTPWPDEKCNCGHRWDCHRWTWGRRRIRIRWRRSRGRSVAHACNVVGCECKRFSWARSNWWQRPLRRIHLLEQAPHIGVDEPPPPPKVDTSIPDTAQPGAIVTREEHAALDARPRGAPQADEEGRAAT